MHSQYVQLLESATYTVSERTTPNMHGRQNRLIQTWWVQKSATELARGNRMFAAVRRLCRICNMAVNLHGCLHMQHGSHSNMLLPYLK